MVAPWASPCRRFAKRLHFPRYQAGSLFSVMMIIAAITSSIAGRLADKFGRKTVLISGLSLLAPVSVRPVSAPIRSFFYFLVLPARLWIYAAVALRSDVRSAAKQTWAAVRAWCRYPTVSAAPSARFWQAASSLLTAGAPRLSLCGHCGSGHAVATLLDSRPTIAGGRAIRLFHRRVFHTALYFRDRGVHRWFGLLEFRRLDSYAAHR